MEFSISRDKKIARSLLVLFFVLYCLLYGWTIHDLPPGASSPLHGSIIVSLLWTAFLFGAIWTGHNWARYFFLILSIASVLIGIPALVEAADARIPLLPSYWALFPLHILVIFTLIYLPAFRTLVRK